MPAIEESDLQSATRATPLRILIVTYNWPPRNAIGTHRPYAWARYWSAAGAQVTVLTAEKQIFDEPLDMPLEELKGVDVITVRYGRSKSRLMDKILRIPQVRWFAKQLMSWLNRTTGAGGDPRAAWRTAARTIACKLASDTDVVVSTFGPAAAHLIAHDMKLSHPALIWVADYRDLWSQSHTAGLSRYARNARRRIEVSTVGRYADMLTAVSHDMVRRLQDLTAKPVIMMIPNGFDVDVNLVRQRLKGGAREQRKAFRIVYTGMVYKGHRDPIPLLDALVSIAKKAEYPRREVTIDFYGGRLDVVEALSRDPTYRPFIRIMGHVPREQALQAQRGADVLLLLESSEPEARGVLTGKIFEYMTAGCPILCIGSRRDFEIGHALSKTRTGMVFTKWDQARLEQTLLESLNGGGLFEHYRPDVENICRFSRERIADEFFEILKRQASKTREIH